jgi:hypothetical protein
MIGAWLPRGADQLPGDRVSGNLWPTIRFFIQS